MKKYIIAILSILFVLMTIGIFTLYLIPKNLIK